MLSRHRDGLKPHFQVSIQNSGYAPSGKDAAIFMRPNPMAVSLERDDKFGWKVRRSICEPFFEHLRSGAPISSL